MSDESTPQDPQPSEMELLRAEMRAGFQSIDKRFDQVDGRLDKVDARLQGHDQRFDRVDARLAEHDTRFVSLDTRFVSLDTRITTEEEATRRHMEVVVEGLRAEFQVVIDKTVATGKKVDRLIASNAIEHAAFLDAITDHEVRITRLETPPGSAPAAGDR